MFIKEKKRSYIMNYDKYETNMKELGNIVTAIPSQWLTHQRTPERNILKYWTSASENMPCCECTVYACSVTLSRLTLCNPVNCSLPTSSFHGISQARILERVAISFSRGSSDGGIKATSSVSPALASRFFTTESHRKPCYEWSSYKMKGL